MDGHLLRYNENQKYVVWDGETCHLNLGWEENKIWQLGFLICRGSKILEKHNYHIKWEPLNITKGAAFVTRFDREKYNRLAKDPKEILDIFEKYLYNPEYMSIFHNGLGFDVYIHNIWRHNLGLKTDYSYIPRCIDTHAIAKSIKLGVKYQSSDSFLAFQYKMIHTIKKGLKTSLTVLGKEYGIKGIDFENLHDACSDVELTFEIWNKLKWQVEI